MFTVTIHTGNAAFVMSAGDEVARILRDIADRLESGANRHASGICYDINGNVVGNFGLES